MLKNLQDSCCGTFFLIRTRSKQWIPGSLVLLAAFPEANGILQVYIQSNPQKVLSIWPQPIISTFYMSNVLSGLTEKFQSPLQKRIVIETEAFHSSTEIVIRLKNIKILQRATGKILTKWMMYPVRRGSTFASVMPSWFSLCTNWSISSGPNSYLRFLMGSPGLLSFDTPELLLAFSSSPFRDC